MATTKNKISEQAGKIIVKKLGREHLTNAEHQEIAELIVQAVNKALSIEVLNEDRNELIQGMDDIGGTAIAHYEGVTVTNSVLTLPVYPLTLPHDAGLWEILDSNGVALIPIPSSQRTLLDGMDEESYLEGQIGFTRRGLKVKFTSNPGATVDVSLLVYDPAEISGDSPLPISPEMEMDVITEVVKLFVPEQTEEK